MKLFIIRGLPGSGKTTLGHEVADDQVFSADDYFTDRTTGEYKFESLKLPLAHANCVERVRLAMMRRAPRIAVANTFSQRWEMSAYYNAAMQFGYMVFELTCNGKFNNVHEVPPEVIQKMIDRWER